MSRWMTAPFLRTKNTLPQWLGTTNAADLFLKTQTSAYACRQQSTAAAGGSLILRGREDIPERFLGSASRVRRGPMGSGLRTNDLLVRNNVHTLCLVVAMA